MSGAVIIIITPPPPPPPPPTKPSGSQQQRAEIGVTLKAMGHLVTFDGAPRPLCLWARIKAAFALVLAGSR